MRDSSPFVGFTQPIVLGDMDQNMVPNITPLILREYKSRVALIEPQLRQRGEDIGQGIIQEFRVSLQSLSLQKMDYYCYCSKSIA
jgi:hypothetical protein